jgi:hypothetical protein
MFLSCSITAVGSSAPKMAVPATMTLLPEMPYQSQISRKQKNAFTSLCTDVNGFGTNTAVNFDVFMGESRA